MSKHFAHLNVILPFSAQEPPARQRPGQDQLEQVQRCTSNPGGKTMELGDVFFLSPFILLSVMLHRQTAPDLLCRVFLQCGMEEAQLGLQSRDEVIHQVGTETSVQGSGGPKSHDFLINIGLFHLSSTMNKHLLCLLLFEHHVFICVCVCDRKTCS